MISRSHKLSASGRPTSVKIASLGVLGVPAIVFTSSVLPPVFTSSSVRAVVNAPVSSLTSPISGTVTVIDDRKGEFYEGAIATVQNDRVDRSTLIGLQVESSSLQNGGGHGDPACWYWTQTGTARSAGRASLCLPNGTRRPPAAIWKRSATSSTAMASSMPGMRAGASSGCWSMAS